MPWLLLLHLVQHWQGSGCSCPWHHQWMKPCSSEQLPAVWLLQPSSVHSPVALHHVTWPVQTPRQASPLAPHLAPAREWSGRTWRAQTQGLETLNMLRAAWMHAAQKMRHALHSGRVFSLALSVVIKHVKLAPPAHRTTSAKPAKLLDAKTKTPLGGLSRPRGFRIPFADSANKNALSKPCRNGQLLN